MNLLLAPIAPEAHNSYGHTLGVIMVLNLFLFLGSILLFLEGSYIFGAIILLIVIVSTIAEIME